MSPWMHNPRGRIILAPALCAGLFGCTGHFANWSSREVWGLSFFLLVVIAAILRAADRLTAEIAGPSDSGRIVPALCFSALFLCILGAKLHLIHSYGSDVPFNDQWDAEANLYPPFIHKTLDPAVLFQPHNEHRVLFTRVLALILLELNGQWDPVLQMTVNAFILASVLTGLCFALYRIAGRKYLPLFCIITGILAVLPYAWPTTLGGFFSPFYFLLGFSLLAIILLIESTPFSYSWWSGVAAALCAQFSMASGFLALAAAAMVSALDAVLNRRLKRCLAVLLVLVPLSALGFLLVPHVPGHDALRVTKPLIFLTTFGNIISWPFCAWALTPLIWTPLYLLFRNRVRERRFGAFDLFVTALGAWVLLQAAAMAYTRGDLAARYRDIIAVGAIANLGALLPLIEDGRLRQIDRYKAVIRVGAFILAICTGVSLLNMATPRGALRRYRDSLIQESNTARYVLTGDPSSIEDKPGGHIPYPSSERLKTVLALPVIREILPQSIREPLALIAAQNVGFSSDALPPDLPGTAHRVVIGSWRSDGSRGHAVYVSEPIESRFPWLVFDIAGGGRGTSLQIVPREGPAMPVSLGRENAEWRQIRVRAPEGAFRIRATDESDSGWIAFSSPRELATGGCFARRVCSGGRAIAVVGLFLLLLGINVCSNKPNSDGCERITSPQGGD